MKCCRLIDKAKWCELIHTHFCWWFLRFFFVLILFIFHHSASTAMNWIVAHLLLLLLHNVCVCALDRILQMRVNAEGDASYVRLCVVWEESAKQFNIYRNCNCSILCSHCMAICHNFSLVPDLYVICSLHFAGTSPSSCCCCWCFAFVLLHVSEAVVVFVVCHLV